MMFNIFNGLSAFLSAPVRSCPVPVPIGLIPVGRDRNEVPISITYRAFLSRLDQVAEKFFFYGFSKGGTK